LDRGVAGECRSKQEHLCSDAIAASPLELQIFLPAALIPLEA